MITTLKRERAKEKRVARKGLRCRSSLCIAKRKQTRGRLRLRAKEVACQSSEKTNAFEYRAFLFSTWPSL
jgi:hypothetical protein